MVNGHRDLRVWHSAMDLARLVKRLVFQFPPNELWILVPQVSRSANSVPSNLAEGQRGGPGRQYLKFIGYARGSLAELDTQMQMAHDFGYITPKQHQQFLALHGAVDRQL